MNPIFVLVIVLGVAHCVPSEKRTFHPADDVSNDEDALRKGIRSDLADAEAKLAMVRKDIMAVEKKANVVKQKDAKFLAREDKIANEVSALTAEVKDMNSKLEKKQVDKSKATNDLLESLEESLDEDSDVDKIKSKDTEEVVQAVKVSDEKTKKIPVESKEDATQTDEEIMSKQKDFIQKERKKRVERMKDTVMGLKHTFQGVEEDFKDMEILYKKTVNNQKLDETAKDAFSEITGRLEKLKGDFQGAKDILAAPKSDEMQDEEDVEKDPDYTLDEAEDILSDMEKQLDATSDAIFDMTSTLTATSEKRDEEVTDTKDKRAEEDEEDMAQLNDLKDEVKSLISGMKDVHDLIKGVKKADESEDDAVNNAERIANLREDFSRIKDDVDEMERRRTEA